MLRKNWLIALCTVLAIGVAGFVFVHLRNKNNGNNQEQPGHEEEIKNNLSYSVSGTVLSNDNNRGFVISTFQSVTIEGTKQLLPAAKTIRTDNYTQILSTTTGHKTTDIKLESIPVNANVALFTSDDPDTHTILYATKVEFLQK